MLRTFQTVISTPANTMYSADAAMKTGMGVVVDPSTMTAGFPAAEMGAGVYLVDKERIPVGVNAGRSDMSDYDPEFINVAAGEMINLFHYPAGTGVFGTDQFDDAGLADGDRVAVGVDGLWRLAGVPSIYIFDKKYDDNGHELLQIRVSDFIA